MLRPAVLLLTLAVRARAIDNGLGRTPPMGWRSWNCFHGDVNQSIITGQVDALAKPFLPAVGKGASAQPASLLSLGYARIGLDDNWQECGAGVNHSFHSATGAPLINKDRFPDMKAMNDHAHSLGVRTGWYFNNCICKESQLTPNWPPQMKGDTDAIHALGWDGVKLDGCGPSHHLQTWANLLNETGGTSWKKEGFMIENCHDNTTGDGSTPGSPAAPGYPYWEDNLPGGKLVCPMNFWRVSHDIRPNWDSVMGNLQHTTAFQDPNFPVSTPGCWTYPDMLELGNGGKSRMSSAEEAAHFYAWCIVSAPLVLGFDLTDQDILRDVWPLIANVEALVVSQAWAGHPGRLVMASPNPCSGCDESRRSLPTAHTVAMGYNASSTLPSWQIWAKQLPNYKQAVLLVNLDNMTQTVATDLENLGITMLDVPARDIGAHEDLPKVNKVVSKSLAPRSAQFLILG